MTTPTEPAASEITASADEIGKALTFFKVMAFVVGIGLLVLCAEMILKYAMHRPDSENPLAWWPQPHGFVYMIYAVASFYLGLKVRWPLGKMVGIIVAGCVPFVSFVVERKVAREVGALLQDRGAVGADR